MDPTIKIFSLENRTSQSNVTANKFNQQQHFLLLILRGLNKYIWYGIHNSSKKEWSQLIALGLKHVSFSKMFQHVMNFRLYELALSNWKFQNLLYLAFSMIEWRLFCTSHCLSMCHWIDEHTWITSASTLWYGNKYSNSTSQNKYGALKNRSIFLSYCFGRTSLEYFTLPIMICLRVTLTTMNIAWNKC